MKKLMLLFVLLFVLLVSAACGDDNRRKDVKHATTPAALTTANDSTAEMPNTVKDVSGSLTISQGGDVIQPYKNFLWSETYSEGEWLAADGMGAFYLLPEIAGKLQAVQLDATIGFHLPTNAELKSFDIFDANYQRIYHNVSEGEFRRLNGNLRNGIYYVSALVNYTGEYIGAENEHNTYGYGYIFEMTVGDMAPEGDLMWEESPPLYHIAIVRTDGWREDSKPYSPEVTVISTCDEMNAFRPDADYGYHNFDAFRELIKQYGPTTFDNGNVLISIHITDSTGSAGYSVESVSIVDKEIEIGLRRTCPEAFNDDEAQWLIFIELEKGLYHGQSVNVELVGV